MATNKVFRSALYPHLAAKYIGLRYCTYAGDEIVIIITASLLLLKLHTIIKTMRFHACL